MTDFEKVKTLFDELGIGYRAGKNERLTADHKKYEDCLTIALEQGSEKVSGYAGFCTIFEFLLDGSFDVVGAWE